MENKVTFWECFHTCLQQDELIKEYNRLFESDLWNKDSRPAIHKAVDKATEFEEEIAKQQILERIKFAHFVNDYIWIYLPLEARSGLSPFEDQ